jgi:prevent-host-death family protein
MARTIWSLRRAQTRFNRVTAAARRAPQTVTVHGKPRVVVVDASEFARLQRLATAAIPSFAELLLAIPKGDGEFERIEFTPRDVDF